MKKEGVIENRVRGLLVTELERRVEEGSKRLPHLCHHNQRQPLDTRKTVEGEPNSTFNRVSSPNGKKLPTIGLCMLGAEDPEQWQGTICEDPLDAQRCPYFNPIIDKKMVWEEFAEQLGTPEWVSEHMPELEALCWVLGDDIDPVKRLPWWKRMWFRIIRVNVEPLTVSDVTALLPAVPEEEANVVDPGTPAGD